MSNRKKKGKKKKTKLRRLQLDDSEDDADEVMPVSSFGSQQKHKTNQFSEKFLQQL